MYEELDDSMTEEEVKEYLLQKYENEMTKRNIENMVFYKGIRKKIPNKMEEFWVNPAMAVKYKKRICDEAEAEKYRVKMNTLSGLEAKYYKELMQLEHQLYYADKGKKFITCKNCKSRISVSFLRTNKCCCCGEDLRPVSLIRKNEKKREKYWGIREKSNALAKEFESKKEEKVFWYVRIF